MSLADGWRLAVGTLTRFPVRPPAVLDRGTARVAMTLAPVTALPLAAGVAGLVWVASQGYLPALVAGLLSVGLLAWATRLLHLDGLSDTVDGLTASTDRDRSLAVMRSGTAGPAGVVGLVVVLGLQAAALGALSTQPDGPWLAAACVLASRSALPIACARGIPAAREEGLGATVAGTVHPLVALLVWLLTALLVWGVALLPDPDLGSATRALLAPALAFLALAGVLRVALRRLGGVTGDVLGSGVEVMLTVLLVAAA